MKFPDHFSLSIGHNEHKNYYSDLAEYIENDGGLNRRKHLTDEEYEVCIITNELWEIHLYRHTPVSFDYYCAPTLEKCLKKLNE